MPTIIGTNSSDTISGTERSDLVISGNGDDTIETGGGNDVILSGNGDDTINSGDGHDLVISGKGDDTVNAGSGNDVILTGKGDDTVDAGDGHDLVITGKGDDTVDAGDGNDLVITGRGDDNINAGDGSDLVVSGSGNDTVVHIEADNLDTFDIYYGNSGWDTLNLVISQAVYNSSAFQADLAHFQSMLDSTGSATGTFSSIGIAINSFEAIEVTITDSNSAPTAATVDLGQIEEDGSRLITAAELLSGASDVDGDALTISSLTIQSGGGSLSDNLNGTWTYTPQADDDTQVTFAYTVSDGTLEATSTASLDMTPLNDAPVAEDGSAMTDEDTALNGSLPQATDVDGDVVTYALGTVAPANGSVTIDSDGSYTYTPDADTNGTDTFSYTVSDGNGGLNEYTFTIDVAAVNDAPVTTNGSQTTTEDTALSGTLVATDIDSTNLTYELTSGPSGGTLTLDASTGAYTYTPATDFNGSDSFTYRVSDGQLSATATIALTVTAVNDAPVATSLSLGQIEEDGSRLITAAELLSGASDVDGDALTISSLTIQSGGGSLSDNLNGTWTYTPQADDDTQVTFAYTVSDGTLEATSTASLDMTPLNDAPVAEDGSAMTDEDTALNGSLPQATDVDGDVVTYALGTVAPANGSVTIDSDGSYTYTPDADTNGTDTFSYTVSDGNGGLNEYTFTIDVAAVNDAPVTTNGSQTTTEDTALSGTLVATDIDSTNLTYELTSGPSGGTLTLDASTGAYTYTPATDFNGSDSFTYRVSDGQLSATATIALTVTAVNDAPVATSLSLGQIEEDGSRLIAVAELLSGASDVDGDALTISSLTIQSGGGSLSDNLNGTWTYTPQADDDTQVTFAYTVSDGTLEATSTASLDMTPLNDAPVAEDGSAMTDEDTALNGSLPQATDVDGDVVTYALGTVAPANGSVTIDSDGSYTYTPDADTNGTDTFSYTVSDGNGGSNEYTFAIDVAKVNDGPQVLGPIDPQEITENNTSMMLSGSVSVEDPDIGDTLSLTVLGGNAIRNGTLLNSQTFEIDLRPMLTIASSALVTGPDPLAFDWTFDADPSYFDYLADGDTFRIEYDLEVSDGTAPPVIQTLMIEIKGTNDAPIVFSPIGNKTFDEDTQVAFNIGDFAFGDAEQGGPIFGNLNLDAFLADGAPLPQWLSFDPQSGDFSGTPPQDFNGDLAITVRAFDDEGASADQTFTLSFIPVNDAPVAEDGSAMTDEDTALNGSLPQATDVDGDVVTYALGTVAPANGSVTIDSDGSYTYTPDADTNGTDTFSYTVSDGNGGSNEYTFAIDVAKVNDGPQVLGPIDPQEITENNTSMMLSGSVSVEDPDIGDTLSLTVLGGNAIRNGTLLNSQTFEIDLRPMLTIASSALVTGPDPLAFDWTFDADPSYFDYLADGDTFRIEYDLEVSDGTAPPVIQTLMIEIKGTNDAPIVFSPIGNKTFDEDTQVAFNIGDFAFGDAEQGGPIFGNLNLDAFLADGAPLPQWLSFDPQSGDFSGTPPQDFNGDLAITVRAFDDEGASADQTFTLSFIPVNDAPVAEDGSAMTDEDTALNGSLPQATDVDGDVVTYALGTVAPANGSVTIDSDGSYTYTPDADTNGTDTFSYTVSDGNGGLNEYTFTIDVAKVNDGPQVLGPIDPQEITENNTSMMLSGSVSVEDPDIGDTLSLTVLGGNAIRNGTLLNSQTFEIDLRPMLTIASSALVTGPDPLAFDWTFDADPSYFDYLADGDTFRIEYDLEVSDGTAPPVIQTLMIEIKGTNDAPIVFSPIGNKTFDEDTQVAFNIGDFAFGDAEQGGPIFGNLNLDAFLADGAPLPQWLSFDPQSGDFSGTPPQDFNGDLAITVRAFDDQGASADQTFTLSFIPVNDAPVAEDGSAMTDEDTALNGSLPQATDVDGDVVTYALGTVAPANGSVTIDSDGSYTYTPDADTNGTDTFSYIVSDGNGGSNEYTFTVEVSAVNDAPVASRIAARVSEDGPGVTVSANFTDPDVSDTHTFSVNTNGTLGTVINNGDGTFRYDPNGAFESLGAGQIITDAFTYTVDDGNGGTSTETVTVTIDGQNDAPEARAVSGVTDEDGSGITVWADFTDVDEPDTNITSIDTTGTAGLVTNNLDNSFHYDPNGAFESLAFGETATDTFTYTVQDQHGGIDTAVVTVTITGQNDAPEAQDITVVTEEDTALNGALPEATDVDGDVVSYSAGSTVPQNGTVNINGDGTYSYTPAQDFNGLDSFSYIVSDGNGGENEYTFTVEVSAVNDDAIAVDDVISVNEDTSINVKSLVLANDYDVEGDLVDVTSITTGPTNGTLELISTPGGHDYTYTPDENFNGQDSFVYRLLARDLGNPDIYGNVTINVLPVNDAPEASDDEASTEEDVPLSGALPAATDAEGDVVSYSAGSTVPQNGTVTINGDGTYSYTPAQDFNGFDSFSYVVSDDNGSENEYTFTVEVSAVNDAPVASDSEATTEEDVALTGALPAVTDVDGDVVSYSAGSTVPQNGTVTINGDGTYSYTPAQDFNGFDSFSYIVSDGNGGENEYTFSVEVSAINDDARAVDDVISVNEDTSINVKSLILANDYDVEGDLVDVTSITALPTNGIIELISTPQGHDYTYTPDENFTGQDSFVYRLLSRDPNDPDTYGNVTINVLPLNDDPVALDDSASVAQGGTVLINALNNDSDVDEGQTLSITQVTQGSAGSVLINGDGTIRYTPDPKFAGVDSFSYTVSDGNGASDTAVVSVDVLPVTTSKEGVVIVSGSKEAEALIANSENNVINSGLGADLVDGGAGIDIYEGTLDELDGDIITNFEQGEILVVRQASFTYEDLVFRSGSVIIDFPDGQSVSLQNLDFNDIGTEYSVIVAPIFDDPISGVPGVGDGTIIGIEPIEGSPAFSTQAVNDAISVSEDGSTTFNPLSNDIVQSGVTAEIYSVGTPSNGVVIDNGDGTVTYTPNANFSGTDSFSYSFKDANDPDSSKDGPVTYSAIVSVLVSPENDRPVAQDSSGTTLEDVTFAGNLIATDVDGPFLAYSLTTGPNNGELDLNTSTGAYTYTPNANFFGSDSFSYSVSDGELSSTATVSLTITSENDRPTAIAVNLGSIAEDGSRLITATELLTGASDVEGPLILSNLTIQTGGGQLTDNLNGTWSYIADANDDTEVTFAYTVSDGELSNTSTATLDFIPENDVPVASNGSATTIEDITINGSLPTATDGDGDTVIYALATGTTNGAITVNGDGTFVYSPATDFSGSDNFTYTVSDGNGGSNTYAYDLTITAENDAPVALDDTVSVAEDGLVFIDVLANDSDVDNGTPTILSVSDPQNGVALVNAIDVVYQPGANFVGNDSFTYTIRDSGGKTATATVNVTVTPVNDAPDANGEVRTIVEDTDLTFTFDELLANDSDVDNDNLTIATVAGAVGGAVSMNAGAQTVTFDTGLNFNGAASFNYTISDGNGGTDQTTVAINVTAVNDVPIAISDSATTVEEQSITIDVLSNDLDFDGDNLLLLGVSGVDNGFATENLDGTVTFTPTAGFIGTETFQYSVTDGQSASQASVTVTVEEAPPVILTGDYLTGYSFAVTTDGNGDTTGINVTDIDTSDGNDGVTQVGLDDELVIGGREIFISTNPEGGTPQVYDGSDSEGQAAWDIVIGSNGDDQFDTKGGWDILFGREGNDTLNGNGGIDRYFGNEGDDRYVHFSGWWRMEIEDNGNGNDTAHLGSLYADHQANTDLWRLDINGDDLNIIYEDLSDNHGVFITNGLADSNNDGQLNSLDEDVIENFQFQNGVTLTLGELLAQEGYNNFNGEWNSAPEVQTYQATSFRNQPLDLAIFASDRDGDPMAITSATSSAGATVIINNDLSLTYTPTNSFVGEDTITYTVADDRGGTTTKEILVSVVDQNQAPVANDDVVEISYVNGSPSYPNPIIDVFANDSDPDQDTLTFTSYTQPEFGRALIMGPGQIQYINGSNSNFGRDSFTYTVSDGNGGTDTATVTILDGEAPNGVPYAVDDYASVAPGEQFLTIPVLSNDSDPDGDSLILQSSTHGMAGYANPISNSEIQYLLILTDFEGVDSFTYTIQDSNGATDTATVYVTVGNPGSAPEAKEDLATTTSGKSVNINVLANDTSTGGDDLFIFNISGVDNGSVEQDPLAPDLITFTPDADFVGIEEFTYEVEDASGNRDTGTVKVEVNDII
ncbi:tandem-95 repeat protein [Flexibacterium corallicola]|uniref:tandem-95 repeat protein n=1 Tax=Flexibacterium corallicola TaxID=3037259 RepID=UPI00286EC568|nr:Ig-like domain-containing protein [Pseudovibrio sp. M1P-2-3]